MKSPRSGFICACIIPLFVLHFQNTSSASVVNRFKTIPSEQIAEEDVSNTLFDFMTSKDVKGESNERESTWPWVRQKRESGQENEDDDSASPTLEPPSSSTQPRTPPSQTLEKVKKYVQKIVQELSQYNQKFILRLIRMTAREDLNQMPELMKDFDISPERPIFFIAGGLKSTSLDDVTTTTTTTTTPTTTTATTNITETTTILSTTTPMTTTTAVSEVTTPLESIPEPQIPATEESIGNGSAHISTTELIPPSSSEHDMTNTTELDSNNSSLASSAPEPELLFQETTLTSIALPVIVTEDDSTINQTRRKRSVATLDELRLTSKDFPVPGRMARTENPFDEGEEFHDEDHVVGVRHSVYNYYQYGDPNLNGESKFGMENKLYNMRLVDGAPVELAPEQEVELIPIVDTGESEIIPGDKDGTVSLTSSLVEGSVLPKEVTIADTAVASLASSSEEISSEESKKKVTKKGDGKKKDKDHHKGDDDDDDENDDDDDDDDDDDNGDDDDKETSSTQTPSSTDATLPINETIVDESSPLTPIKPIGETPVEVTHPEVPIIPEQPGPVDNSETGETELPIGETLPNQETVIPVQPAPVDTSETELPVAETVPDQGSAIPGKPIEVGEIEPPSVPGEQPIEQPQETIVPEITRPVDPVVTPELPSSETPVGTVADLSKPIVPETLPPPEAPIILEVTQPLIPDTSSGVKPEVTEPAAPEEAAKPIVTEPPLDAPTVAVVNQPTLPETPTGAEVIEPVPTSVTETSETPIVPEIPPEAPIVPADDSYPAVEVASELTDSIKPIDPANEPQTYIPVMTQPEEAIIPDVMTPEQSIVPDTELPTVQEIPPLVTPVEIVPDLAEPVLPIVPEIPPEAPIVTADDSSPAVVVTSELTDSIDPSYEPQTYISSIPVVTQPEETNFPDVKTPEQSLAPDPELPISSAITSLLTPQEKLQETKITQSNPIVPGGIIQPETLASEITQPESNVPDVAQTVSENTPLDLEPSLHVIPVSHDIFQPITSDETVRPEQSIPEITQMGVATAQEEISAPEIKLPQPDAPVDNSGVISTSDESLPAHPINEVVNSDNTFDPIAEVPTLPDISVLSKVPPIQQNLPAIDPIPPQLTSITEDATDTIRNPIALVEAPVAIQPDAHSPQEEIIPPEIPVDTTILEKQPVVYNEPTEVLQPVQSTSYDLSLHPVPQTITNPEIEGSEFAAASTIDQVVGASSGVDHPVELQSTSDIGSSQSEQPLPLVPAETILEPASVPGLSLQLPVNTPAENVPSISLPATEPLEIIPVEVNPPQFETPSSPSVILDTAPLPSSIHVAASVQDVVDVNPVFEGNPPLLQETPIQHSILDIDQKPVYQPSVAYSIIPSSVPIEFLKTPTGQVFHHPIPPLVYNLIHELDNANSGGPAKPGVDDFQIMPTTTAPVVIPTTKKQALVHYFLPNIE